VAAPIYCKTIAYKSVQHLALLRPQYRGSGKKLRSDPKLPAPKKHADYRPLHHITPIMSRLMQRNMFRTFLYPTLLDPPPSLAFSDQFAFHPSGSTSAAVISLLHTVINLLQFNPFVVVISLDFSIGVRHHPTTLHAVVQVG